jgi:hypothetical protein
MRGTPDELLRCSTFFVAAAARADARIEQARREGELVWYTAITCRTPRR